jgi:hypothetical protein
MYGLSNLEKDARIISTRREYNAIFSNAFRFVGSGKKSDTRSRCDDGEDRRQRNRVGAHSVPVSALWRAASKRYAAHMHNVLSTIQEISQKRLKGMPRTTGSTRSQSGTEKHIATNGIKPKSSAPRDGFFNMTRDHSRLTQVRGCDSNLA